MNALSREERFAKIALEIGRERDFEVDVLSSFEIRKVIEAFYSLGCVVYQTEERRLRVVVPWIDERKSTD